MSQVDIESILKHLGLTELKPPSQAHSETSKAAAEAIEPRADTLRGLVLDYLRRHGPATDERLQEALSMGSSTERPRRRELELAGLIRDSGRTAKTRSGRSAVLWEAIP